MKLSATIAFAWMGLCPLLLFVSISRDIFAEPLPVKQAAEAFVHSDQLQVQLVAAEPAVIDPVDLAFDEQGRLWVAEMRDYPNGPAAGAKPQSTIKILRDTNGDGLYETATVFADELLFVTGLLPWKGGVIVTSAGQITWMTDEDGDDQVDRKEVWLEGFAEENPQLRANHPTLGADGWIYVANGLRGGEVTVVHPDWPKPAEPISLRGKDFRFHPVTGVCEAIAGNGQYGMSFDQWGNRLICSNRNPAMQVMFQFDNLAAQPLLIVSSLVNDISPSGDGSKLFPLTGNWTTSNLHAGQFTAACGVHSYQGTALPTEFRNAVFACDPTANLVHGDPLKLSGASFEAVQPHQPQEFLASTDSWFRPVNLKCGPDGSLYVLDMYRAVIEHPQFMPDELKNRPDLVLGNDRGRIWKVTARSANPPAAGAVSQTVSRDDRAALLEWLMHPNVWQRQTAARLILESRDPEWIPLLAGRLAEAPAADSSTAAIVSLLANLGGLESAQLKGASEHASPIVRFRAVQLLDAALQNQVTLASELAIPMAEAALQKAARDPHPHVRFAALIALRGKIDDLENGPSLLAHAVLIDPPHSDVWLQKASLLGIQRQLPELLRKIRQLAADMPAPQRGAAVKYAFEVSQLIGRRNEPAQVREVLAMLWQNPEPHTPFALAGSIVRGLGTGLRSRGTSLEKIIAAEQQVTENNVLAGYPVFVQRSLQTLKQSSDLNERLQGVQNVKFLPGDEVTSLLVEISRDRKLPGNLRTSSLEALQGRSLAALPGMQGEIVEMVRSEAPQMRRELIDFCLSNADSTRLLLENMRAGKLNYRELANDQVTRLTRSKDPTVLALHQELQATLKDTNRDEVIADYLAALKGVELTNEQAFRGREVFLQQCATCHKMGADGVQVGPDISDTRTKQPSELLIHILDPNKAIDNNFFSYTAVTIDGKVHTGILAEETPYAITLKQAKGEAKTIQREEIEEFASDGVSFMPQGLEKNITREQMIDLISFLKNWRYLDGTVPLK